MKWLDVVDLALELPEVSEGFWFNTPSLKARGKSFVRLKEDRRSIVFLLESVAVQQTLISEKPAIYFITDHYRGWPAVLARLSALRKPECRLRLERAWRVKAPKKLVQARDQKLAAKTRSPASGSKKI